MEEQTNNIESLVHCRQMSYSDFGNLSAKDPQTIYFVNQSGVFTGQSMEGEGDIYLGDKLLTRKFNIDGATLPLDGSEEGSSLSYEFELEQELTSSNVLDFFVQATVQNKSNADVSVESWAEIGHYENDKYETDTVIASSQTFLLSASSRTPVTANICMIGTLNGPVQGKSLKICFEATDTIDVIGNTTAHNKSGSSRVLIRTYKTQIQ